MANANSTCVELSLSGVVCYGVFFNYEKSNDTLLGVNCSSVDNFDPDVAGIGVVISFTASCIITTLASIAASVLDNIAGSDQPLLPRQWRPANVSETLRERCLFARRILDRLILDFADQQLVTGFALLISAWVKLHTNAILESLTPDVQHYYLQFPNLALPNAEFSLIVFLCMASSSSHLACILVLRDYMETHRSSARLRIVLMILFACFLAVTIALASSLTAYFAWLIVKIFSLTIDTNQLIPYWESVLIIALCMAIPLLAILAVFWLCTLQLSPRFKRTVQTKLRSILLARLRRWFRLSKIWHGGLMKLLPEKWRQPFTEFVKRVFWFMILGNESVVFSFQVVFAILSIVWISLQRLAVPPEFWSSFNFNTAGATRKPTPLCSLHNVAGKGEIAAFGQLLPLIFLVLPLFSAYGSYIEEKDRQHELESRQRTSYAAIPSADASPQLFRRPSRKQRQSQYEDESELSLLSPRRHESEPSNFSTSYPPARAHSRHDEQGSSTGIGIRYNDGQSPPPRAYSIGSLGFQGQGSMGWPTGYSTGVDEEHQSSPGARH